MNNPTHLTDHSVRPHTATAGPATDLRERPHGATPHSATDRSARSRTATPSPAPHAAPRPGVAIRIIAVIRSILLWLGSVLGVICIVLFLAALLFGVRSQIVISGSMEPRMPVGSLVLVTEVPSSEVAVGDIVTVPRADGDGLVTHRVQEITTDSNGVVLLTLKGDANLSADPQPYPVATVGKVFLVVPGLGYVAAFLQGPAGIVVIGAVLVLILLAFLLPAPGSRRARTASEASASAELDAESVQRTDVVETTTELSGDSAVTTANTRDVMTTGGHRGSRPGAATNPIPVVAPESGDFESHDRHTVTREFRAVGDHVGPRTPVEAPESGDFESHDRHTVTREFRAVGDHVGPRTPVEVPESGDFESHDRHITNAAHDRHGKTTATATATAPAAPRTRAEARALAATRSGVED